MLQDLPKRILDGAEISFEEALELTELSGDEVYDLIHAAWKVTRGLSGAEVDLCSIINAKSGRCSEDCRFCAQSGRYHTGIETYPLLDASRVLEQAREIEQSGAHRFSLVISGRGPSRSEFDRIISIYETLKSETRLNLCASLGVIDKEQARRLAAAGVTMYHHNLETCRSFFPSICSSHTYDDRVATVEAVKKAGMRVCCGGILSMGESWRHRVEFAFELKELGVDSVPINILNPIEGTPFEHLQPMSPLDTLKSIAIFRLALPKTRLRLAGGRAAALRDTLPLALQAGINAMLVGNYLTTAGRSVAEDVQMLSDLGLSSLGI
ncbi:MAG: biotin synthase BioB [Firmicutes bacterium]|nr:biotin synthase BioB [Bacillota bacterium]